MQAFYENKDSPVQYFWATTLTAGKHLHHHVEMVIPLSGSCRAFADEKGDIVRPGQIFVSFPNQIHYYIGCSSDLRCLVLIFLPNTIPEFYRVFSKKLPKSPVMNLDDEQLKPIIRYLSEEMSRPTGSYSESAIIGCISIILSSVFSGIDLLDIEQKNTSAIKSVLIYCNENYKNNITLENIAANVHMSKYYISHIFSKEIGVSFTEYINSLRIQAATELLKSEDMSITEVAFAVGFNSLRSFNRHFLALTGTTPRQIKKAEQPTHRLTDFYPECPGSCQ